MPPGDAPRREGRVRERSAVRRDAGERFPVRRDAGERFPVRRDAGERFPVRRDAGERSPVGRDRDSRYAREDSGAHRGGRYPRDEAHGHRGSARNGSDDHRGSARNGSDGHSGSARNDSDDHRGRRSHDRGGDEAAPARAAAGAQEIYRRLPVHPLFAPRAEEQSVGEGGSAQDASRPNPYLESLSATQRRRQAIALDEKSGSGRTVQSESKNGESGKPKSIPLSTAADVAWWDGALLEAVARGAHVFDAAVQRPRLSAPPAACAAPPPRVHLTREETRRVRRQRRLRAQREAQELARLGLGPRAESPRVRLATLGRVPGAVLSPTALEVAARADAARRRDAHERANAARSLAARQARAESREATAGAGGLPAVRAVFCVQGGAVLGVPARFRVTKGAVQHGLSGVAVFSAASTLPVAAVVAVHGPPAGVARYRRLLERRVRWPPGCAVRVVHAGARAPGVDGAPRRLHTVDAGSAAEARRALRVHGLADVWDALAP